MENDTWQIKNKGIDLVKEAKESSHEDWVFGAISPTCIALIPKEDRIKYLPKGELQFGKEDFMDCSTRGALNILETKFNYLLKIGKLRDEQWFKDNGYINNGQFELSDRFNAILSNTTRDGNSLKAPLDSIRKDGVIPKVMLPANSNMTWADYHNKKDITDKMIDLGKEFLKRYKINYEKVFDLEKFDDLLDVAGYAWSSPVNGIYPKIEGMPNHVWVNIRPKYLAFDNYLDVDQDFIKELSPDYIFYSYGYRIIISEAVEEELNRLQKLLIKLLQSHVALLIRQIGNGVKSVAGNFGSIVAQIFSKRN